MALGLLASAMYISCIFHIVCASFSALATRKLADAEANSSGIWALDSNRKSHHKEITTITITWDLLKDHWLLRLRQENMSSLMLACRPMNYD